MKLLDYSPLIAHLEDYKLSTLACDIPELLESGMDVNRYGDIPRWEQALEMLPDILAQKKSIEGDVVTVATGKPQSAQNIEQLKNGLRGLMPWRKGPFKLFNCYIDTEWRSDYKWQRLVHAIEPLGGKRVLDVGCGSGYHCWRMAGEGAALVLGIDPTPLFIFQYWALQKYLQNSSVWVLPARMEALPKKLHGFDTVFSMGVLYHRRSPFDHLQELKDAMAVDAELVLETLVIEGGKGEVLVPEGRYAKMGNVWFIPSVLTLCGWLKKLKFAKVEVLDVSTTTFDEQRSTDWMQFHSLRDFLDPADQSKTVEGYPAPRRVIISAKV
jgi:tRNA (mo5U34)-methyltransferase